MSKQNKKDPEPTKTATQIIREAYERGADEVERLTGKRPTEIIPPWLKESGFDKKRDESTLKG